MAKTGKEELVNYVAGAVEGLTKKDASAVIDAVVTGVKERLAAGDSVTLVGFGTFEVRGRKARVSTNPQTKAPLNIPAKNVPAFKAGKGLKEAIR